MNGAPHRRRLPPLAVWGICVWCAKPWCVRVGRGGGGGVLPCGVSLVITPDPHEGSPRSAQRRGLVCKQRLVHIALRDSRRVDLETIEGLPHPDDVAGVGITPEVVGTEGPVVHLLTTLRPAGLLLLLTSLSSLMYSMWIISRPMKTILSTQLY